MNVSGMILRRTGQCNRCGACEKPKCQHWSMTNGISTCDTYGHGDYIDKRCYVFPDSPFCYVVRQGICGYEFIPTNEKDADRFNRLMKKWR